DAADRAAGTVVVPDDEERGPGLRGRRAELYVRHRHLHGLRHRSLLLLDRQANRGRALETEQQIRALGARVGDAVGAGIYDWGVDIRAAGAGLRQLHVVAG